MSDLMPRLLQWRPLPSAPADPIGGSLKSYPSSKVDEFLNNAKKFLGQWYLWGGGHNSSTGIQKVDCSGLVLQAARLSGLNLDGTAAMQQDMGRSVSMSALQPGDLVFHGNPASHVGIYLGNNKVIHAPHTGAQVQIVDLSTYHYFDNARRVFDGNGTTPTGPSQSSGTPTLRKGANGAAVRTLQEKLKAQGFDPGGIDGDFGPKTDAAVRAFQRARGLEVDGVVGPKTWAALNQAAPKPAPAPAPAPKPTPAPAPATSYTVKSGDTLYKIAQKTLGDANRWREIYDLNKGAIGANPNILYPGTTLKLPGKGAGGSAPPAPAPAPAPTPQPAPPGLQSAFSWLADEAKKALGWLKQMTPKLQSVIAGMKPPG